MGPPPIDIPPDARIATRNFIESVRSDFISRKVGSNLNVVQQAGIRFLQSHPNLTLIKTDKNLGPGIIERHRYVEMAFQDHLNDQVTYRSLTQAQAIHRIAAVEKILSNFKHTYLHGESNKNDWKYMDMFHKSFKEDWATNGVPTFARFYILAKVHKTPLSTQPIVLVLASITEAIGRWVDNKLQTLFNKHRNLFPYYLKSSRELVQDIAKLELPANSRFFSCDAVSMYTNIDTSHALTVIDTFLKKLPARDVHPGLMKALEIVM